MPERHHFDASITQTPLATAAGDRILSTVQTESGASVSLALPKETAEKLVSVLFSALGQMHLQQTAMPSDAYTIPTHGWAIVSKQDGYDVTFGLPGKVRLAFHLRQEDALILAQSLCI